MPDERTPLTPQEEAAFQSWAKSNALQDVDHPDSHYDYRGFWKSNPTFKHEAGQHFPDTFKQHGHPTFSVESQYSAGPEDGGRWNGDSFIPSGADLQVNSRGQSRLPQDALSKALLEMALRNK